MGTVTHLSVLHFVTKNIKCISVWARDSHDLGVSELIHDCLFSLSVCLPAKFVQKRTQNIMDFSDQSAVVHFFHSHQTQRAQYKIFHRNLAYSFLPCQ